MFISSIVKRRQDSHAPETTSNTSQLECYPSPTGRRTSSATSDIGGDWVCSIALPIASVLDDRMLE